MAPPGPDATPRPGPADQAGLRIRAAASAPAKCILLGEHAVVYGEPCLSVALDLRTTVIARAVGDAFTVNGYPLERRFHAYFVSALEKVWRDGPAVRFESATTVPSTSGIGSSAALTVATVAALRRLQGDWDTKRLAQDAFDAERAAQGAGSPNDTSVATAGGGVLLAPEKHNEAGLKHLWTAEHGDKRWEVHRVELPRLPMVIGVTGIRGRTAEQVARVRTFVERSAFGRETVQEIGGLVWKALDALRGDDLEALGTLMDRCQADLHTMGVNHPALQRLVDAAKAVPGTFGAKLTGAGGGGSMIALAADPQKVAAAIERAGGHPYIVEPSSDGVRIETDLELSDSLPEDWTPAAFEDAEEGLPDAPVSAGGGAA